jgi:outer membrane protein OmpA-like peptidoglycan-associated protein
VAIAQTDLPPLPAHKPEHKASGKALKSGPNNMPAVAPTAVKTEIIVAAPIEEKNPSSTKADSAVKDIGSSLSPSLYFDDYGYVNLSPDKDDEILSENDVVKRKTPPKPQIINAEPVKTSSKTEFTLIYEAGAKQLTPDSQKTLGTQAAHFSKQPDDWRIQIHAYASSPDQSESSARRLSLSRALSLRKYFMDRKIPAERIDIKALGQNGGNNEKSDRSTDRPSDRVDIIFYDPNS